MTTDQLEQVLSWIRGTDLVEVSYKSGGHGFSLAACAPAAALPSPACRFSAVTSPAIGSFQWNRPGQPRRAEEGAAVESGQLLGVVETAKGKFEPVAAPSAGAIARCLVDAGAAVEYGQPLFFLETR